MSPSISFPVRSATPDASIETVIHVHPDGDDRATGTESRPFASLERARQEVRRLLGDPSLSGPVVVAIAGGTYHLPRTVELGAEDSGTALRPVSYVAAAGEHPVLSAGRPVHGWTRLSELPAGVDAQAAGALWAAPWDEGSCNALFDGDGLLPRANAGPFRTREADADPAGRVLLADPADLRPWHDPASMEVALSPTFPWLWNILPLRSLERTTGTVTTAVAGSAPLRGSYLLENVPEGLRSPGTWWLDRSNRRLVLWPRRPGEPAGIVAPALVAALRLAGQPNRPIHHLRFRGLTFSHGKRPARRPDDQVMIPLHDWEFHDQDNAVVRLQDSADVTFEDCVFHASGGSGLRIDHGARRATVLHSRFHELGNIAISLVGRLPGDGDVHGDHELGGNHIHRTGRILRCAPGILLYQSGGNRIRDNLLHDLPYAGIVLFGDRAVISQGAPERLYGGGNLIEHNEVTRIMQQLGDGTAIYLSATPAGNIVRRNHVHDVERQINGGIRTDDQQSGVLVAENLIRNLSGFGIILKHVNQCRHNIVVDCRTHISVRHWGPNRGSAIVGNIIAQFAPVDRQARTFEVALEHNPYGPFFSEQGPVKLRDYELSGNVLFAPHEPALATRALQALAALGKEPGVVADPGFADPAAGDFRLAADSPACRLGFPCLDGWGPRVRTGPRTAG